MAMIEGIKVVRNDATMTKQSSLDDSTNTRSTVTCNSTVNTDESAPQSSSSSAKSKSTGPSRSSSEPMLSSIKDESSSRNLNLRFSTLTIREYPRILGDNVTVLGPPISISWDHEVQNVYNVEEYDDAVRDTRRTQAEMKMAAKFREDMMRDYGYSRKEILEASKKATIARNHRKRTVEMIGMQPVHEVFEKVKSPFKFGKRKEKKRLSNFSSSSMKRHSV